MQRLPAEKCGDPCLVIRPGRHRPRARKVGIVALARKLLIALWRWLEHGEVPEGAKLCPWWPKVNGVPKVAAA